MPTAPRLDQHVLAAIPRFHGQQRPSASALICGDQEISFLELDQRSNAVAHGLLGSGLAPGARVAVMAKDSIEVFELLFGIAKAGCVFTGINWRLAGPEVHYILEHGEVEALFVDAERLALVTPFLAGLPRVGLVVVLDCADSGAAAQQPPGAAHRFARFRDKQPTVDPQRPADPEEVVAQLYTSGTTGRPKGVLLANRSFFAVVAAMRAVGDEWIGWGPRDMTLFNIPSFHIGGLWWAMTALAAGATGVVMPVFDAACVHGLVPRHRITKVCCVPAMIQMVLAEPGVAAVDWSSLECLVYGGAPIPKVLVERASEVFECELVQIYGLTETGNTAVCLRAEDHHEDALLLAAGRPYPGVELKVVGANGSELGPHELGEVCLRSPANMLGYWRNPEATAQTLRNGWVHTGDAGLVDERGYLFIRDRIKDMIITAGENVYPAEIESVLSSAPGVLEAAVIGIPHGRWGESVLALVVRTADGAGRALRKRALLAHCRKHLADFKVPAQVEFTERLPRTPSGKVKKNELRAPYWVGRERKV